VSTRCAERRAVRSTKRHGSRELYEIQDLPGKQERRGILVLMPGLYEEGHGSRDDTRAEDSGVD
jgi:CHASE1-domain containing sensor protein